MYIYLFFAYLFILFMFIYSVLDVNPSRSHIAVLSLKTSHTDTESNLR